LYAGGGGCRVWTVRFRELLKGLRTLARYQTTSVVVRTGGKETGRFGVGAKRNTRPKSLSQGGVIDCRGGKCKRGDKVK